nr:retrovirus-related Pol polyprotein from transposon TNT 1-94 [Tanacetum cinerariifolium]
MKLKERPKSLSGNVKEEKIKRDLEEIETINIELDHRVTKLVAENEHLKQTYKKLYDSIKSSRVRSKEQWDDLIKQVNIKCAENSDLNATLQEKVLVITALKDTLSKIKRKVVVNEAVPLHSIDPELLKIDVAPLAPKSRNNRTAHNDYLKHTQEETATLREIVENERLLNPLNTSLDYAYTKAISSVPNSELNVNPDLKCAMCNRCLFSDNHDSCVLAYINSVNACIKFKSVKKPVNRKFWQPTGKMFTTIGHIWRPTGRTFTLVGNVSPLTRITTTAIVPLRKPIPIESNPTKPVVTLVYSRKSKAAKQKVPVSNSKITKSLVVQIVLWYLDSECSKHMTEDRSQLINFIQKFLGMVRFRNDHVVKIMGYGDYKIGNATISRVVQIVLWYLDSECSKHMTDDRSQLINFIQKFLGMVRFRNDHVVKIMGYGDYKIGNATISRVYFVEGLGHNLFSVGQFCDSDLEVAFRQHTYFIRNLDARQGLVQGIPKLKFEKDHLCSACAMGKSKKKSHKPKSKDTNQEKLYLLHIDLYGPMRVESVNGKKYILVIIDDYSRFTWGKLQLKADIGIFIGYAPTKKAFRIYNRRTRQIVETINVDFDELTAMASEQSSSGPALNEMTPTTISSRIMQKSSSSTPYVPPSRNDWDLLFQPMFDELRNPPPSVDPQAPKVIASIDDVIPPIQAESTGSPSSTTVDQDAPSPSKSQTTPKTQSSVIPQDVEEDIHDIKVAHMGNDLLFGVPILEVTSAQSSSTVFPHTIVQSDHQFHNTIANGQRITH